MARDSLLSTGLVAGSLAFGLCVAHLYRTYQRHLQIVGNTPGLRTTFSLSIPAGEYLPHWKLPWTTPEWRIAINPFWFHLQRYKIFEQCGQDIISALSLDTHSPTYLVADADVAQKIMRNRFLYPKPTEAYVALDIYGRNVGSTEGSEWRLHRRITAPTFSESNNKLVCNVTVDHMEGPFELWKGQDIVEIPNVSDITFSLALMVIAGAGFGMDISWADAEIPSGHQMSFKEAIAIVSTGIFYKVVIPKKLMGVSKEIARIRRGFDELEKYMLEMIEERAQSNNKDLFTSLIAAYETDNEKMKLNNEELMGNIFAFLVAGHETTAHSLAFVLGLVALYQDVQEKLYNEIKANFPDPSIPFTYKDINRLTYASAIFNETLRLFPMTPILPKTNVESTTFKTTNNKGETVSVPIPEGSRINVNITAIHRNPKYWEDPDEFKPERFMGDWPRHAFLPFSTGPRACMGRRFAEVEILLVLSMLVQRYKIETKDAFPGETFEAKCSRVLTAHQLFTPSPSCIPITLTFRK